MTKKKLEEIIKDMPEDMEVMLYTGAFYRPIEDVNVKKVWIDGKQIEVITLQPTPYAIKVN